MESGETPWDAVIREVREETGFDVEVERLVGVYSQAPQKDKVILSFVSRITGGQPTASDESDSVRFFALDALPFNTLPDHVRRLRDALLGVPYPVLKGAHGPSSHEVARGRRGGLAEAR
jgi:ADP-ribose pyrophosphatase YjhB (NUDIX family)